jgi:hypothetical protein
MAATQKRDPGRQAGKVRAVTTLSPVRVGCRASLSRRLRLINNVPFLARPLAELSFIHYARWTLIDAVADADGSGRPRPLNSSYLLFESNYNGGLGDYLDAFADVLPHRLTRVWGTCVDFDETVRNAPGSDRRMMPPDAFRRYVDRNSLEVLNFYAAYSEATMVSVRQSLFILEQVERATRARPDRRERTARALVPFVFGPAPPPQSGPRTVVEQLRMRRQLSFGTAGIRPLTLVVPLDPARAQGVLDRLLAAPDGEASPLAALPQTHYARFALLPRDVMDLGQPDPDDLGTSYLVFTSNFRGRREEHLEALAAATPWVWEACAGFDGTSPEATRNWFKAHAIGTRYFVQGYPAHRVEDIRRSLRLRAELAASPPERISWAWIEAAQRACDDGD